MQRQKDSVNLMTFIKPHQSGFLLSIILAVISVTSGIVPYFAVARIVNLLIGGETNFSTYLTWGIVALIAYLMKSVFHGLSTRCSHEATFHVLSEIRQAVADKLTRVSMGYLTDTPSGRLKTTMVERVEQMEVPLAHIIPEMTSNLLVPIAIIIYLFVLDWRMALVSLITIPIGMLCYMAQMKEYPKKYGAVVQASKYMSATTVEYINGIEVIKAFNQSAASYGKFTQAVRQSVDLMLDWMKSTQGYSALMMTIWPAVLIGVLPVGCLFYMNGSLSAPDFITIAILSLGIMGPLVAAIFLTDDFSKIATITGEITAVLSEPDLDRPSQRKNLKGLDISLRDVTFAYKDTQVLNGITLDIKQGTTTALVGPSGSGKSTIAKLIASYWDVGGGHITIGGVDAKELPPEQVMDLIGYVSQDNFLFNLSVRENIRMGRPEATDAEVEAVAKAAGCHEFIMGLEHGYDTDCGRCRRTSFRRRAAAGSYCTGHDEKCTHCYLGRGNFLHRPRKRGGHSGCHRTADSRKDTHCDRPSPVHHYWGGTNCCGRSRKDFGLPGHMENCWIGVRSISKCGQLTRRRETTIRWKEVRRMFDAYKRFFRFSGAEKGTWYKGMAFELLRSIFEALQFVALLIVLRALVEQNMTGATAWTALGIMAVSVAGAALCWYLAHNSEGHANYRMCGEKRIHIGERMKYMPMGYFNAQSLGSLTAAATSTMSDLESMSFAVIARTVVGMIRTTIFSLAIMCFDWRIGLVFFVGMLLFLWVNSRLLKKSRELSPGRLAAQTKLVDAVLEYIQGMSVVRAFHGDKAAKQTLNNTIKETENQNFKLERKRIPYNVLEQVVLRVTSVLAILLSIWLFLQGNMSLFTCLMMVVSAFLVYSELESAGEMFFMLPMIDASIDRVEEIDRAPRMDEGGSVQVPKSHDISFEHVDFSYGDRKIIDDVSFTIPEGTTTAIVGPSGSGKTTLTSLMARFWDVNKGSVKLGGIDVKDYSLDSLMSNFSMVFQNVYLFNDSIENNIKFGKPAASHEEVVAAAKAARCHDFIMALPDGYDTVIGEGGATISGGERQRLSIARAMLKDAPIVILDEATANVDPENEAELQAAIEALTGGKTIIMIAHRLKTVRHANQILVVDHGRIVQHGTHDQLIQQKGIYADFILNRKAAIDWKINA